MMESSERHVFAPLHLVFGLLHERGCWGRKHVIWINPGINQRFPFDDDGISALRDRHQVTSAHFEVVENFARDHHLTPLPHAPDALFCRGYFPCHPLKLN